MTYKKAIAISHTSLDVYTVAILKDTAKALGIKGYGKMKKAELVTAIYSHNEELPTPIPQNPTGSDIVCYKTKSVKELKSICKDKGVRGYSKMRKAQILEKLESLQFGEKSKAFESMTVKQLKVECRSLGIRGYSKLRKAEIVKLLVGNGSTPPMESESIVENDTPTPLSGLTVKELKSLCKDKGISGYSKLRKAELVATLDNGN